MQSMSRQRSRTFPPLTELFFALSDGALRRAAGSGSATFFTDDAFFANTGGIASFLIDEAFFASGGAATALTPFFGALGTAFLGSFLTALVLGSFLGEVLLLFIQLRHIQIFLFGLMISMFLYIISGFNYGIMEKNFLND